MAEWSHCGCDPKLCKVQRTLDAVKLPPYALRTLGKNKKKSQELPLAYREKMRQRGVQVEEVRHCTLVLSGLRNGGGEFKLIEKNGSTKLSRDQIPETASSKGRKTNMALVLRRKNQMHTGIHANVENGDRVWSARERCKKLGERVMRCLSMVKR